jgi:pyruvate formate lyase activating enzyme
LNRAPLICDIKGNALDDGPGIRTAVFFKGCPLSCVWCHNPETIDPRPELAYDRKLCIEGCKLCMDVCTEAALDRNHPRFVDRRRCTCCWACLEVCPSKALSRVGTEMSVEEAFAAIAKDEVFFKTSGGGVTFSGGEATMYVEWAGQLARACRQRDIHVLLETNGCFVFDRFIEYLYPHLSQIYFDIKIIDPEQHRRHCGTGNALILKNFAKLNEMSKNGGVDLLARVPLIPGITATEDNLAAIAAFLRDRHVTRVALLPNNPLWGDKLEKLGGDSTEARNQGLFAWIPLEEVKRYQAVFTEFEIV